MISAQVADLITITPDNSRHNPAQTASTLRVRTSLTLQVVGVKVRQSHRQNAMIKKYLLFSILFSTLALLTMSTLATETNTEVRYVIDKLIITMRSGQSNQHQILRTWPSNTKLEILETGEQYSRARGPDGTEGWVLNQYITAKPTARIRLATTQQELARAKKENTRLAAELAALQKTEGKLSKQQRNLSLENKKQMDELKHLRRVALKLENENQRLKKELLELESEHELLLQENQMLGDSSDRDWFLNGAGVIILGIIIGLIAPRLRVRKKSSWGSL
ncbi:MAG: TIGR04211 family SH3 domain-containing protein [Gammaproteobacteria bacterium]|nr:TIGR04211 family SH3 domain-containing protein [Gammaproteobacteria bacterium]